MRRISPKDASFSANQDTASLRSEAYSDDVRKTLDMPRDTQDRRAQDHSHTLCHVRQSPSDFACRKCTQTS
jgi:hypothetical protein